MPSRTGAQGSESERYKPIANYGVVGNLSTVALVAMDGAIDFLCWPRFDSPSIFAALLDSNKGGSFQLSPTLKQVNHKQLYLPDSNVLLTRFLSNDGIAEISDFMEIGDDDCPGPLVRRAKTVVGTVRYEMTFDPRFNYGRSGHRTERRNNREAIFISHGPDKTAVRLKSEQPFKIENGMAIANFKLRADQTAAFVLESADAGEDSETNTEGYIPEAFKRTVNFWHAWIQKSHYRGRWREMVDRSALTLKLLTSAEHGSIVAAPTFGFPEDLGGVRNWDYRYTWIRDASFTMYALMRLGYKGEATAFMRWIEARCTELKPGKPLQIMYGIDGRHDLAEKVLKNFEGYKGSKPVRIGNAACDQLQLDIYGELMDSIYIYNKSIEFISYDFWRNLVPLIDWVVENWRRPDEGIWEVRGGKKQFLYSRVMCWVAVDRGIRLAQKRSFPAPLDRWIKARDRIYKDVYQNFWNEELKTFVQYKGSKAIDASALLMPLVKFIGPNDPKWLSTLKVINEQLVQDSLVYRYDVLKGAFEGCPGREGTFSMCSFWNVECLARSGDLKQARYYFEKALGYANHLGLYSEELGANGEQLGNFPQAFTHLALISAAFYLNRRLGENGQSVGPA
jgi:GH15 family glucan-1,4-alpha-glucosidase